MKNNSPQITPSFLKHLSMLADENRFYNDLEHIKKLDYEANVIAREKKTHCELAQCLRASCISPLVSTFVKAIKNNHFSTWHGLTLQLMLKQVPKTIATHQVRLHSENRDSNLHDQTKMKKMAHHHHLIHLT